MISKGKMIAALVCGMLGCLCFGGGDWLMVYGDANGAENAFDMLTNGAADMEMWRQNLAMAVAFPGIILYGIALFSVQNFITDEKHRKIYHYLNAFGLTPWLALHLFYIMILALFGQLCAGGHDIAEAQTICTELYNSLSWVVIASEAFMLPVFAYWFWLQITKKTVFPRAFAFTNVLLIFAVLKGVSMFINDAAFSLAFRNGLMSESMIIWFAIMVVYVLKIRKADR